MPEMSTHLLCRLHIKLLRDFMARAKETDFEIYRLEVGGCGGMWWSGERFHRDLVACD